MHLGSPLNLNFLLLLRSLLPMLLSLLSLSDLNLLIQRGEGSKKGKRWLRLEDLVQPAKTRLSKLRSNKRLATCHNEAWRADTQPPEPQAWLPAPMLDGEPLREDASLRDFNGGIGCHVASTMKETLLLPKDMSELWNIRKNEIFLNCKRYLGIV